MERQVIEKQALHLAHRVYRADPKIRSLVNDCYEAQVNLTGFPLVAHEIQPNWPWHSECATLWRIRALLVLRKVPLGTSWQPEEWLQWLLTAVPNAWNVFPCVQNIDDVIKNGYLIEFSRQLILHHIIGFKNNQFYYLRHAHWFASIDDKLVFLQKNRK